MTSRLHADCFASYPDALTTRLVECAALVPDIVSRSLWSAPARPHLITTQETPKLTYPSETNSFVICDLMLVRQFWSVLAPVIRACPTHNLAACGAPRHPS